VHSLNDSLSRYSLVFKKKIYLPFSKKILKKNYKNLKTNAE
jgi:hypothetical protein